jgi:hypothetical protein
LLEAEGVGNRNKNDIRDSSFNINWLETLTSATPANVINESKTGGER